MIITITLSMIIGSILTVLFMIWRERQKLNALSSRFSVVGEPHKEIKRHKQQKPKPPCSGMFGLVDLVVDTAFQDFGRKY